MAYNPPKRLHILPFYTLEIFWKDNHYILSNWYGALQVNSSLVQIVPMVHITSPSNELSKNYPPCNMDGKRLVWLNWRMHFRKFSRCFVREAIRWLFTLLSMLYTAFQIIQIKMDLWWAYNAAERREKVNCIKEQKQFVLFCVHTPNDIEGLSNDI